MPSTLVHVALGGLIAAALLAEEFDGRSLAVALAAAALPDVDTFVGLWVAGAHRALLHTLLLPTLLGGAYAYDVRLRERSWLRERWGARGVRVAGASLAALLFAGIFPDLFTNGVNAFYPIHDAFYAVDGRLVLSNERGVVQTFVEWNPGPPERTTENFHYWTGVDPTPGRDPSDAERIFPVVTSGMQLMLVLTSAVVVTVRLRESQTGRGA